MFRHYLLCQKLTFYINREALKYVINMRDTHGSIAIWMSMFAEDDFEIKYRPGEKNSNVDYLSRPVDEKVMVLLSEKLEKS